MEDELGVEDLPGYKIGHMIIDVKNKETIFGSLLRYFHVRECCPVYLSKGQCSLCPKKCVPQQLLVLLPRRCLQVIHYGM